MDESDKSLLQEDYEKLCKKIEKHIDRFSKKKLESVPLTTELQNRINIANKKNNLIARKTFISFYCIKNLIDNLSDTELEKLINK